MNQPTITQASSAWVLALASIASFMIALDALVVTTALDVIRRDLGASIAALEWTVNAYNLSFAVLLMTGAALGDRFGRRRMFVTGLVVFAAASAACALAPDVASLIAARAVQGAGAALVMPLAMALLSVAYPAERRARALGVFSSVTGLAVLSGPVVGGAIAEGLAWQWIFWINLPIAALVVALAGRRITESFGPHAPLDVGGLALITAAALCAVWGLVRANAIGWSSLETLAAFAGALLLTLGFIGWERRATAPMLPLRFFAARAFSAGNTAGFCLTASLYGSLFFVAQFLQATLGHGPMSAGLRVLPWTATLFVVAPLAGAFVNRIGERPLVVYGLALQAIGLAWLGWIAAPGVAYAALVAPLIIAGAGVSMAIPAAQNAALGAVSPREVGKASGTFNTLRFLGGVFGVALMVAVFRANGGLGSAASFGSGFAAAMLAAAALSCAGMLIGLCLPARAPAPAAQRPSASASSS